MGLGGLGKSSLAAEVTHALAADPATFPGGIAWVRCDDRAGLPGLTWTWTLDHLLAAWGASIPAEEVSRAQDPEEALALRERALRERMRPDLTSAPTRALVLLDNVERGLPLERLREVLQPLGITPVLTMRSEPFSPRLRLLRLEVLPAEAARSLFAERYAARGRTWVAQRDSTVTTTSVEALGRLPLAIELAAAHAARTRLPLAALGGGAAGLHAPDAPHRSPQSERQRGLFAGQDPACTHVDPARTVRSARAAGGAGPLSLTLLRSGARRPIPWAWHETGISERDRS